MTKTHHKFLCLNLNLPSFIANFVTRHEQKDMESESAWDEKTVNTR